MFQPSVARDSKGGPEGAQPRGSKLLSQGITTVVLTSDDTPEATATTSITGANLSNYHVFIILYGQF